MAKKIDLSGFKQFLFDKGEKLALAVCGAIAVLLLVLGVMTGINAGKVDYKKDYEKSASGLQKRLADARYEPPAIRTVDTHWDLRPPTFPQVPYNPYEDSQDNKRRNPPIYSVGKDFQIDYVLAGNFAYEVDPKEKKIYVLQGAKGGGGGADGEFKAAKTTDSFAKSLKDIRMLVVSATFPMRAQIAAYSQALQVPFGQLKHEDMPKPLGLEIYRQEIKDGKPGDWQPLYNHDSGLADKTDQIRVAQPIDDLLRRSFIEEENPKSLKHYIVRGLVTPLPRLGNSRYPRLELPGIQAPEEVAEADPDPKANMGKGAEIIMPKNPKSPFGPKGGPGAKLVVGGAEVTFKNEKWQDAKLPEELKGRFLGDYNAFDPLGSFEEEKTPKDGPFDKGKIDPKEMFKGKEKKKEKNKEKWGQDLSPENLLVRFFDCGVEPGKTYRYSIQLRMENPNFGKKDLVAAGGWAEIKELFSDREFTPLFTIPGEYAFYAVDQPPEPTLDPKVKPVTPGPDRGVPRALNNHPLQTTIQIHKFVPEVSLFNFQVADWAIAERVLVSRGEYIGRPTSAPVPLVVELPVWEAKRNGFVVANVSLDKKKGAKFTGPGVPIDFQLTAPPMLIDFDGGKQKRKVDGASSIISDDSAIEILVLGADGKLIVRNSRADSDLENPEGRERIHRVSSYRDRLHQVHNQGQGGGGVKMPGKEKDKTP